MPPVNVWVPGRRSRQACASMLSLPSKCDAARTIVLRIAKDLSRVERATAELDKSEADPTHSIRQRGNLNVTCIPTRNLRCTPKIRTLHLIVHFSRSGNTLDLTMGTLQSKAQKNTVHDTLHNGTDFTSHSQDRWLTMPSVEFFFFF